MSEKKNTAWFRRLLGVTLVFLAGGLLFIGPLQKKRTERKVRTMLLQVQKGLQNYHIDEELYPKRMQKGGTLVAFLDEEGHLSEPIVNPWSGETYTFESEPDFLSYRTDELAETYELIVTFPGSEEVQFRLDSTKNRSLE